MATQSFSVANDVFDEGLTFTGGVAVLGIWERTEEPAFSICRSPFTTFLTPTRSAVLIAICRSVIGFHISGCLRCACWRSSFLDARRLM
jgi:hypothetical protein